MTNETKLTLTEKQTDALEAILIYAIEDRENYLQHGNPQGDYGADWPEARVAQAGHWRELIDVFHDLGFHGYADRAEAIAEDLEGRI